MFTPNNKEAHSLRQLADLVEARDALQPLAGIAQADVRAGLTVDMTAGKAVAGHHVRCRALAWAIAEKWDELVKLALEKSESEVQAGRQRITDNKGYVPEPLPDMPAPDARLEERGATEAMPVIGLADAEPAPQPDASADAA